MNKYLAATILSLLVASIATSTLAQGPWMAEKGNTWGWQLMTPEERVEHQNKMRGFKTYDECKVYLEEHRKLMETRAKEKGVTLPAMRPSAYACDNMKAQGFLK